MAELKKCPFCGGKAKIRDYEDLRKDCSSKYEYYAECERCKVQSGWKENVEDAETAWNNRATEAELRASVIDEFAGWCYINGIDFSYMAKGTDKKTFVKTVIERFNSSQMKGEKEC